MWATDCRGAEQHFSFLPLCWSIYVLSLSLYVPPSLDLTTSSISSEVTRQQNSPLLRNRLHLFTYFKNSIANTCSMAKVMFMYAARGYFLVFFFYF